MKSLNNKLHYASIQAAIGKLDPIVLEFERNIILSGFHSIKNDQDEEAMNRMDGILLDIAGFYNLRADISAMLSIN